MILLVISSCSVKRGRPPTYNPLLESALTVLFVLAPIPSPLFQGVVVAAEFSSLLQRSVLKVDEYARPLSATQSEGLTHPSQTPSAAAARLYSL